MLVEESIWISNILHKYLSVKNYPLLNIGSSTQSFREKIQPHIHRNVFLPLINKNLKIIHLDMKMDEGVDMIGDLSNVSFRNSIKTRGINSVLCSNLLEHLDDPKSICDSIVDLLNKGGLIIVTVPFNYPFHEDPIDTMFRPNVNELHKLFDGTKIIESEIVESEDSYLKDLLANKKYLGIMILRIIFPFYKPSQWTKILNDFVKASKKYSATCIIMEKI